MLNGEDNEDTDHNKTTSTNVMFCYAAGKHILMHAELLVIYLQFLCNPSFSITTAGSYHYVQDIDLS